MVPGDGGEGEGDLPRGGEQLRRGAGGGVERGPRRRGRARGRRRQSGAGGGRFLVSSSSSSSSSSPTSNRSRSSRRRGSLRGGGGPFAVPVEGGRQKPFSAVAVAVASFTIAADDDPGPRDADRRRGLDGEPRRRGVPPRLRALFSRAKPVVQQARGVLSRGVRAQGDVQAHRPAPKPLRPSASRAAPASHSLGQQGRGPRREGRQAAAEARADADVQLGGPLPRVRGRERRERLGRAERERRRGRGEAHYEGSQGVGGEVREVGAVGVGPQA